MYRALKNSYDAIGNLKDDLAGRIREWKVRRTVESCGEDLSVNGPTFLSPNTVLGDNVNFNGLTAWGDGRLEIGDNFHSGKDVDIHTMRHAYTEGDALPYDDTEIETPVTIGDHVWIGHSVIVLGECTIGDGAVIQAGSVVVSDIPERAIAGGHPAEVFAYRDEERYERLVKAQAFH